MPPSECPIDAFELLSKSLGNASHDDVDRNQEATNTTGHLEWHGSICGLKGRTTSRDIRQAIKKINDEVCFQEEALRRQISYGFDKKTNGNTIIVKGIIINFSAMGEVQSVQELVDSLERSLAELKPLLASDPKLSVANILHPKPGEISASVRDVIFQIFDRTAKALGRNSPEAVKADTKEWVRGLESFVRPYALSFGGHFKWIEGEVKPRVDPDMVPMLSNAEVFHHLDIPLFKKFYQSLANLRRPERKARANNPIELITRKMGKKILK
jgi:hypothetical protein